MRHRLRARLALKAQTQSRRKPPRGAVEWVLSGHGQGGEPREEVHRLTDDGAFPNRRLPLLVRRGALSGMDADAVEARFAAHGWTGAWRNGIRPFHHFHSTSHEVPGCYAGHASVCLGGPTERGVTLTFEAGAALLIPAGVGQARRRGRRGGLGHEPPAGPARRPAAAKGPGNEPHGQNRPMQGRYDTASYRPAPPGRP